MAYSDKFIPKKSCTEASGACFAAGECLSDCTRVTQREHVASANCWCGPAKEHTDEETGVSVWLHRMTH